MDKIINILNDDTFAHLKGDYGYNIIMAKYLININDSSPEFITNIHLKHFHDLDIGTLALEIGNSLQIKNGIKWYEYASKLGNAYAHNILAKIYNDGIVVARNLVKVRYYTEMANQFSMLNFIDYNFLTNMKKQKEDIECLKNLITTDIRKIISNFLLNEKTIPIATKIEIYRILIELDYPKAHKYIIELYEELNDANNEDIIYLFRHEYANQGDIISQLFIGNILNSKNNRECIEWFNKVISNDGKMNKCDEIIVSQRKAALELGKIFYGGVYMSVDYKIAFDYFIVSKNNYYLAKCYASGKGIEKDIEKAKSLFKEMVNDNTIGSCFEDLVKYYNNENMIESIENGELMIM